MKFLTKRIERPGVEFFKDSVQAIKEVELIFVVFSSVIISHVSCSHQGSNLRRACSIAMNELNDICALHKEGGSLSSRHVNVSTALTTLKKGD